MFDLFRIFLKGFCDTLARFPSLLFREVDLRRILSLSLDRDRSRSDMACRSTDSALILCAKEILGPSAAIRRPALRAEFPFWLRQQRAGVGARTVVNAREH